MTWPHLINDETPDALARLVQVTRQTELDSRPGDHRVDLADSLPDHCRTEDHWTESVFGEKSTSLISSGILKQFQNHNSYDWSRSE